MDNTAQIDGMGPTKHGMQHVASGEKVTVARSRRGRRVYGRLFWEGIVAEREEEGLTVGAAAARHGV